MLTTIVEPSALHERLGSDRSRHFRLPPFARGFCVGTAAVRGIAPTGALFAAVEEDLAGERTGTNGRHPMPDPEVFARFLRDAGVSDGTHIVAYDAGGDMFAARLWFLCRWIGHDGVAVLDGGFAAWTALGFPVTADVAVRKPRGDVHVRLRPELVVDAHTCIATSRVRRCSCSMRAPRNATRVKSSRSIPSRDTFLVRVIAVQRELRSDRPFQNTATSSRRV